MRQILLFMGVYLGCCWRLIWLLLDLTSIVGLIRGLLSYILHERLLLEVMLLFLQRFVDHC